MRRVRLVCWRVFYGTPLAREIDEAAERKAAERCKLPWPDYLTLKRTHTELWQKWEAKRARANANGFFPPPPLHLLRYRQYLAPAKAKCRKERPRFREWAIRKIQEERRTTVGWLKHRILDRLSIRLGGH